MVLFTNVDSNGYLDSPSTTPIGTSGIYISNAPDDFIWELASCYRYEEGGLTLDQVKVMQYHQTVAETQTKEFKLKNAETLLQSITASAVAKTAGAETALILSPLFPHWSPGIHNEGDSVLDDNDYPWTVRAGQTHDSTNNPDWAPGIAHSLWRPYHGVSYDTALPWLDPTLAAYDDGEWMIWSDGKSYRCNRDATIWGPDVLPEVWVTE